MKTKEQQVDWEKIYDENADALLLYARQFAGSIADAEDALHEGFIKVYRSPPKQADAVRPLLFKAVKWAALDRIRGRQRREDREQQAIPDESEAVTWFVSRLEDDERRACIENAMKTMNPEQRDVLTMKIWGGLTFKQIAEALDLPAGTVASRYRYGLETLREKLEPEFRNELKAI